MSLSLLFTLVGCVPIGQIGALVPPTADQDPALPQINLHVDGRTRATHVTEMGDPDDPLLLLLYGSLGDHRAMLDFEPLSDRYHVIAWDQRGNGLSERITADEYGWDSIVEEIDEIREVYGHGEPVTLIGHSFGAMFTSLYLFRRPNEVAQAVLMEPGGLTGEIFGESYADIIEISLLGAGLNRGFWQSEVLSPRTTSSSTKSPCASCSMAPPPITIATPSARYTSPSGAPEGMWSGCGDRTWPERGE